MKNFRCSSGFRKAKNWTSLSEIFRVLNEKCVNYIVLRNYEGVLDSEHVSGDIDFLCENRKELVCVLGAELRGSGFNEAHYEIFVQEKRIEIDVREIGDGYYCADWEKSFLKYRENFNGIFVMDPENHFYSILYHCLIHKGQIPEKYSAFLSGKCPQSNSTESFRTLLFEYMSEKKYLVTNSSDWELNVHFDAVPDELIYKKNSWEIKRFLFRAFRNFYRALKKIKREDFL